MYARCIIHYLRTATVISWHYCWWLTKANAIHSDPLSSFFLARTRDQNCRTVSTGSCRTRDKSHTFGGLMLPGRYLLWELCPLAFSDLNKSLFARAGGCHACAMLWTHFPRLGTSPAVEYSLAAYPALLHSRPDPH